MVHKFMSINDSQVQNHKRKMKKKQQNQQQQKNTINLIGMYWP